MLVLRAPFAGRAKVDRPLPGQTGGFGEPTCHKCHWDQPFNEGRGSLSVTGFPEACSAGTRYSVTITLGQPELERARFQLAARFLEGDAAGGRAAPLPVDARVAVVVNGDAGAEYALQTAEGASFPA